MGNESRLRKSDSEREDLNAEEKELPWEAFYRAFTQHGNTWLYKSAGGAKKVGK